MQVRLRSSPWLRRHCIHMRASQALPLEQGGSVSQAVTALAAEVRENVKLRQIRWCVMRCTPAPNGVAQLALLALAGCRAPTSSFELMRTAARHAPPAASAAWWRFTRTVRCCVMPGLKAPHLSSPASESDAVKNDKACGEVEQFAAQLAMHVAASDPQYLSRQSIPAAVVDAQRAAFHSQVWSVASSVRVCEVLKGEHAQAVTSGKPANIVNKIVDGLMKKWYARLTTRASSAWTAVSSDPDALPAGRATSACSTRVSS